MSLEFNNQTPKNNSAMSIEKLQKQLLKQQNPNQSNFPMAVMAGFIAALAAGAFAAAPVAASPAA